MEMQVWVCPNGHYYAASGAGDLSTAKNHRSSMRNAVGDKTFEETGTRDQCQHCKDKPKRKLISIEIDLDEVFPELASSAA